MNKDILKVYEKWREISHIIDMSAYKKSKKQ
jgi:hypothetical protein